MKLRQKLAVALATAMVVTSVPVLTMAASDASATKTAVVADTETGRVLTESNAPDLKIVLTDAVTSNSQFYLELSGAEFVANTEGDYSEYTTGHDNVTVEVTGATTATVKVDENGTKDGDVLKIKLQDIKVTGDKATISIDGGVTEVTNKEDIVFATINTAKATVDVKNATSFYTATASTVGSIVIAESVTGSLTGDDRTIVIDMDHSDFEFTNIADITVVGSKGFANQQPVVGEKNELKVTYGGEKEDDKSTLVIRLPKFNSAAGPGTFEIKGIKVNSVDEDPTVGDLNVSVSPYAYANIESKDLTVATVTAHGTDLSVEAVAEIAAGKSADVKVSYKELTTNSLPGTTVSFELSQGYIKRTTLPTEVQSNDSKIIFDNDAIKDAVKKYGEDDARASQDLFIKGFRMTTVGDAAKAEKVLDGHKLTILTDLNMTGDIVITTKGSFVTADEEVIATVSPAFDVTKESVVLKVGQINQVGGKIELTEKKVGDFTRGDKIVVDIATYKGIELAALPKVSATGDMEVGVYAHDELEDAIVVEVKKPSKSGAATITIEDFKVSVDRTVPEGKFDAEISWEDKEFRGEMTLADFIVVGTPNTEDLGANGLTKGTSSFVIGESRYTVNGTVKEMDAASFIQNPGYTMVPVRYVAEAFGVSGKNIVFSNGQATIFAGSRTIQLTNNSDVAVVNGVQIKMATKVVIKEGRTYAPIGEIAQLLGIDKAWDSTSKTATFINE